MRHLVVFLLASSVLAGCQSPSKQSAVDIGLPDSANEELDKSYETEVASHDEDAIEDEASEQPALKKTNETAGTSSKKNKDKTVTASLKKGSKSGIVIPSYRVPKVGTVFTYQNNWKSLEPKTVYKVVSTQDEYKGKKAIAFKAIEGTGSASTTYYDTKNHSLLGYKDKNGNSVITYTSVEQRLKFPMRPGDKWVSSWESYEHSTKKTTKGGGVVKVIGPDKIAVGAGRFKAMKIELPLPRKVGAGMKHFIWYSPSLGVIIREQISNNQFSWSKELASVQK